MLISFRVANHRSIRDEITLTVRRDKRMSRQAGAFERNRDISRIVAIYGPNGSGKSSVVLALRLMADLVAGDYARSTQPDLVAQPFGLNDTSAAEPTLLEVELVLAAIRYRYGFTFTGEGILSEWLYAYPNARRQVWFERSEGSEDEFYFGKHLAGHNKTISELTRPSDLFLTRATLMNHEQLARVADWFARLLVTTDSNDQPQRLSRTITQLEKDTKKRRALLTLLKSSDLGIHDLDIARDELDAADRGPRLTLKHERGDGGAAVPLRFESESLGTRALISLGGMALTALEAGQTLVVDEMDTSLHSKLVAELVSLFQSPKSNRHDAQLIFTSHDASLLAGAGSDDIILYRDQIWFTDKGTEGATRLYPLTDFHPRRLENLERGYLQGRYGAVPVVDRLQLDQSHQIEAS